MIEAGFQRLFVPGESVILFYSAYFLCLMATGFRLKYIAFAGMGVMAVILNFSRSLWFGILLSVGLFAVVAMRARQRLRLAILVPIALIVITASMPEKLPFIGERFLSSFDFLDHGIGSSYSFSTRYYETMEALTVWLETPMLGNGLGVPYRWIGFDLDGSEMPIDQAEFKNRGERLFASMVHNGLAEILLHEGLLGFLLFGNIILQCVLGYYRVGSRGKGWSLEWKASWYCLWTFLVLAVLGGDGFSQIDFGIFFFVILGLLDSAMVLLGKNSSSPSTRVFSKNERYVFGVQRAFEH
jgi:O-antigen ligase